SALPIPPTHQGQPCRAHDVPQATGYITPYLLLSRLGVEKLENFAGAFGADPWNLAEVGDRGPLDLLQRSEMVQQSALARRADARNFLQSGFANVLFAQFAVRPDHEAMRLVAQPLDEIQYRIARLELERFALGAEQGFAGGGE